MGRPSLVSRKIKDKYYTKKIQRKNGMLSQKVNLFLSLFLVGGLAVSYYKFLVKQRQKQNIF